MKEEELIKKGFNAGYQLEKHDPELAKIIQKSFADNEHPYSKGFNAGCQELINENTQELGHLFIYTLFRILSRKGNYTINKLEFQELEK